jgi:arabinan endo-1,5-alpha-L-arabinosidase
MKKISFIFLIWIASTNASAQTQQRPSALMESYNLPLTSLRVRDPFILADAVSRNYYLYVNSMPNIKLFESKDLVNWKDKGSVFKADAAFWGKEDFWAPDAFFYRGKYYLFITFSSVTASRGTSILVADSAKGPFKPLVNKAVTPSAWASLDGTLFIDEDKQPWMIFCREWLEVKDGQIAAQKLSANLKRKRGKAHVLFTASEAPWTGSISAKGITGNVTDAPFLYRAKKGELLMLWSSFTRGGAYAIGVARSESGKIAGPWKQDPNPLNTDDGGHAMIFNDFSGNLLIAYHAPNSKTERPVIYKIKDEDGKLSIQ